MKNIMRRIIFLTALFLLAFSTVFAQTDSGSAWMTGAGSSYWVTPDITYQTANNHSVKLDVWYRHDVKTASPTLVFIHGGGWVFGSKEGAVLNFLPYMEMGWTIVNVEYRMASQSPAPAAVEDTRCALRWVFRNAKQYNFDTTKIVLSGQSAGGHLSLITGMLPNGTDLDNNCYGDEELKVAAIINWYGISDVNDLLAGNNQRNWAIMWMGSQPNAAEIARKVSPLTYVRAGLPPILTVHGDSDSVVPYSQSVRLHAALDKAKVTNKLITIKGGDHGGFSQADYVNSFKEIKDFLRQNKIIQ